MSKEIAGAGGRAVVVCVTCLHVGVVDVAVALTEGRVDQEVGQVEGIGEGHRLLSDLEQQTPAPKRQVRPVGELPTTRT